MGCCLVLYPNRLNGTELSWEELRDKSCLRYGLMPHDISATSDCCGKRFLINDALSFPNSGLVLVWHDETAKEWGALRARALVPSAIFYKPKINSKTVQE